MIAPGLGLMSASYIGRTGRRSKTTVDRLRYRCAYVYCWVVMIIGSDRMIGILNGNIYVINHFRKEVLIRCLVVVESAHELILSI